MSRPKHKIQFLYFFVDLIFIVTSFFIPYLLRLNSQLELSYLSQHMFILLIWVILIVTSLKINKLYFTDRMLTIPREAYLVLSAIFYPTLIIVVGVYLTKFEFFPQGIFLCSFISMCFFLSFWRAIKRAILRDLIINGFNNFNTLIIGSDATAKMLFDEIQKRPHLGLRVLGIINGFNKNPGLNLPVLGVVADFEEICKKYFIEEVFIASINKEEVMFDIVSVVNKMYIGVRIVSFDLKETASSADLSYLGSLPILTYQEMIIHPANLFAKRIFDIFISALFLFILFPVLLIIAIIVKIDTLGPILFIQKRTGKKGRIFDLYKFRSMINEADQLKALLLKENEVKDGVIFKMRNDPRLTKVGRFLRKYSLDELPQFINVFRGDISLVGPRPFPVDESQIMGYKNMTRLNIKPGITGLAQVRGRSDLSFYRWTKLDLWYVSHWSLGLDIKILLWTIPVVFKAKGAY